VVGATDAIIVPQAIGWESLQELVQGGAAYWGVQRLWLAPALQDLLTTGMEVHQRGSLPLLSVTGPRLTGLEAALKRGLDIALVLIALPLTLPLCLVITAWLALAQSTSPIVLHRVIGRDRSPFTLITFAPTPTLLRLHLWRLPAFLNVIIGDLSLVGPRPVVKELDHDYRPWRLMLASMRPGLTGPWWLQSGSHNISIEAEVRLDLAYIRTYTIWSDLRVLALTGHRLVTSPGEREVREVVVAHAEMPLRAGAESSSVHPGGLV
jgi:lipopolysaccharide/colanic/teichoic acid biosynthesis glycosyltransferase